MLMLLFDRNFHKSASENKWDFFKFKIHYFVRGLPDREAKENRHIFKMLFIAATHKSCTYMPFSRNMHALNSSYNQICSKNVTIDLRESQHGNTITVKP